MPTVGAIYIAKNSRDEDSVYKVGMTQRGIEERMRELTSETSNLGEYEAIAIRQFINRPDVRQKLNIEPADFIIRG